MGLSQGLAAEMLLPGSGTTASLINPAVLGDSTRAGTAAESFNRSSFRDRLPFWTSAADAELLKTLRLRAGRMDGGGEMSVDRIAIDLDLFRHLEIGYAWSSSRLAFYRERGFHIGLCDLLDWGRGDWTWWRG